MKIITNHYGAPYTPTTLASYTQSPCIPPEPLSISPDFRLLAPLPNRLQNTFKTPLTANTVRILSEPIGTFKMTSPSLQIGGATHFVDSHKAHNEDGGVARLVQTPFGKSKLTSIVIDGLGGQGNGLLAREFIISHLESYLKNGVSYEQAFKWLIDAMKDFWDTFQGDQKALIGKSGATINAIEIEEITPRKFKTRFSNDGDCRAIVYRNGIALLRTHDLSRAHNIAETCHLIGPFFLDEKLPQVLKALLKILPSETLESGIIPFDTMCRVFSTFWGQTYAIAFNMEETPDSPSSVNTFYDLSLKEAIIHDKDPILEPNDVIIQASDGFWDNMASEEAIEIAISEADPENAAKKLIERVMRKIEEKKLGGLPYESIKPDNVVVHVIYLK